MSFEGKSKKSEQQFESPENKPEKELFLSEIEELLKQKVGIFDSLDKFSKDEIFKGIFKDDDFYKEIEIRGRLNDEYDSIAYQKAGFWEKLDNFSRFGLFKNWHGLTKSEERGLLDKSKINKDVLGKEIEQNIEKVINSSEIEKLASGKKSAGGLKMEDVESVKQKFSEKRTMTKRYEVIGGEIIKIIKSRRTESGAVEAAGKMREAGISRLETVNGADLIGLKESMEKNTESKKNLPKIMEFMSDEEKEKITTKLNEEERQTKEKIKEKEEMIAEELNIFKEPLEGRLTETIEMEFDLKKGLDFIKTEESKLNNQIKEYENYIKKAQKLNLLGDVGGDIVKILEEKKAVADTQAKEFAEGKDLVSSKLEVLKNNKKEIEATLNRINNIGKTKREIEEDKKEDEDGGKNKKTKTETEPTKEKKDDERKEKTWDETRDEAWGLKNMAEKAEDRKTGKGFSDLFPNHDYPGKKKEKTESEWKKEQSESNEKVKFDDNTEIKDLLITNDYLKEIVSDELKKLGLEKTRENKRTVSEIEEKALSSIELINNDLIINRKDAKVKDVRTEFRKWYKQFSENYFKKEGRNEDEDKDESEKNEKKAEKVFTHKEIVEITEKELKALGIMSIKDRTMREQITNNVIMAVEAMIAKTKKPLEEEDIKKEVGDWYRKYSKNYFKKGKQPKT